MEMAWAQACGRRLRRHGLTASWTPDGPAAAAAAMCGAHAQVLTAAEVSIGLRTPARTRTDVRNALWSDHTLIKTFGPRGTIHLLPAADLAMWCGALSALTGGRPAPAVDAAAPATDGRAGGGDRGDPGRRRAHRGRAEPGPGRPGRTV